ncbi:MAG: flavodoxin domain protein [Myxococcales bacterium]|nr:flavodoxin domain protein [Myxococcales bacterium]
MSHILILYASHYGQTRKIAVRISEVLHEQGINFTLVDAGGPTLPPSPEAYDVVVIGSRVEAGKHARDIRSYIHTHQEALQHRPTAFFSVSMAASTVELGDDPNGYLRATFEELDWRPQLAAAFAGKLAYREYGWFLRVVMKMVSRSAGHPIDTSRNHELTDWTAVRNFALDLVRLALPSEIPMLPRTRPAPRA